MGFVDSASNIAAGAVIIQNKYSFCLQKRISSSVLRDIFKGKYFSMWQATTNTNFIVFARLTSLFCSAVKSINPFFCAELRKIYWSAASNLKKSGKKKWLACGWLTALCSFLQLAKAQHATIRPIYSRAKIPLKRQFFLCFFRKFALFRRAHIAILSS